MSQCTYVIREIHSKFYVFFYLLPDRSIYDTGRHFKTEDEALNFAYTDANNQGETK